MAGRTFHSIRNIVFGVADRLVTLLVPFVIRTIMIKTLGAAYLGLSNLFASILTVLSLAELGIGSAMVYAMYRPIAEGNKAAVSGLLNLFRRLYGIVGTVILAGGLGLMPVLPRLIHSGVPDGLNLYIIYLLSLANAVFSYFFGAYKSALVTALQRSDLYSIVHVLVHLVLYAAAIAGLLTTKNYYLYASLFPVATIVQNLILSRTVDRYFGDYFCGGEISRETRSELFHNVLALMGHKVGWVISSSIDTLSISGFLGLSAIAVYGNYYYVSKSLSTLLNMLSSGITASVGNSVVLETPEKNYGDFVTFHFLYMLVNGVCCACLISLYQHFINLWVGPEYLYPFDTVVLFTICFYIRNSRQIPLTYKEAAGVWTADALKPYAEGLVNLILNLVLVQRLGVRGIVLATIVSMLFVGLPWDSCVVLKKVFRVGVSPFFARYVYYAAVTAAACYGGFCVCGQIPGTGIAAFLVKGVLCAATAFAVLVVLCLPLPESRSAIRFAAKVIRSRTGK